MISIAASNTWPARDFPAMVFCISLLFHPISRPSRWIASRRRDHYVAETALRKIMSGFLREKIVPALVVHEERLERLSELLTEIPENQRPLVESRIHILESWRRQARACRDWFARQSCPSAR